MQVEPRLHHEHPLLHRRNSAAAWREAPRNDVLLPRPLASFLSVQNRHLLLILTCLSSSTTLHCWAWLTPPAHVILVWFGLLLPGSVLASAVKCARPFRLGSGYSRQTQSGLWRLKSVPKKGVNSRREGGFCAFCLCLWAYPCGVRKRVTSVVTISPPAWAGSGGHGPHFSIRQLWRSSVQRRKPDEWPKDDE